jgi:hypothetical protein
MDYEERKSGFSTTEQPDRKVRFVLNTCKTRICQISLIWQVFFYDQPKSRKKTETSRAADLSFLTALKQPKKLHQRRKKHGPTTSSLQKPKAGATPNLYHQLRVSNA